MPIVRRVQVLAVFAIAVLNACSSGDDDPHATSAITLAPVASAEAQPDQVARDYIAALNSGDVDGLVSLISLPADIRFSAQQPYVTVEGDAQLRSMLAGLPHCTHRIDAVSATGNDVVVGATVSGDSCPFAGTGVEIPMRVQDGHIVRLG
jgi:hypothetical protein